MEEMVDIINEQDEVLRVVPRHVMRQEQLSHRATYVVVMNKQKRIVVELRTLSKDYAPGLLDACVGGVVQAGEDPVLSAMREVEEEIGVDCQKLQFHNLGKLIIPHLSGKAFVMAYLFIALGNPITIRQKSEVSAIFSLSASELQARSNVVVRDSMIACQEILTRAGQQGLL